MGAVIGQLLPLAVAVAISPVPIIAVILMLLSPRPGASSVGFALGWVVGIVAATTVFVLLAGVIGSSGSDSMGTAAAVVDLVLGVLLLLLAVRQWRSRPAPGQAPATPKWMAAIDRMTAGKAAGLGIALAAVNPKNLLMAVAAGGLIGEAELSVGADVVAVAVFTVIAASTVVVPVVAYLSARTRVTPWLQSLQQWLQDNTAAVMTVLLAVIGTVLVGKGIGGLF